MSLTNNLIAHWKLDEFSDGTGAVTRNDSVGSNHLTDINTVASASGKIGLAGNFVAANTERLSIADNTDLSTGDIAFTFSAWARAVSFKGSSMVLGKVSGTQNEYWIYVSGNRFRFGVASGAGAYEEPADALGVPATDTWYFIVAWHDASANTMNIQINNGTVDSRAHTAGVNNSNSSFIVGYFGSSALNLWDGLIDSVSFWKRALTANERARLYNQGYGLDYPFNNIRATVHHTILGA